MKAITVSALLVPIFLLAACATGNETEAGAEEQVKASAGETEATSAMFVLDTEPGEGAALVRSEGTSASFDPECVISETGVAGIETPATLGDFVEAFPAGTALSFQPLFMVDFGALCARSGGEDALCVIFESYEVEEYRANIEVMAVGVYADQCRTAEGIGPGTSIADAVSAYGAARFGFSYDNESREYVSFADAPDAYSFRAESALDVDGRGGDYAGVEGDSYFETVVAQPDAELWEIWLSTSR
jgi:hypothetical protein